MSPAQTAFWLMLQRQHWNGMEARLGRGAHGGGPGRQLARALANPA